MPEIKSLTGIRGFAAFWVLLFHVNMDLGVLMPELLSVAGPVIRNGYMGVDLFFCLSGFILQYNYGSRYTSLPSVRGWARFLWLRLCRVYPVHAVMLLAYAALVGLQTVVLGRQVDPDTFSLSGLAASVALVHAWDVLDTNVWNRPSWSISAEWFAYLWFPGLAALLGSKLRSRGALLGGALLCWLGLLAAVRMLSLETLDLTYHLALVRIAASFGMGACLAGVRAQTPSLGLAPMLAMVGIAGPVALSYSPLHDVVLVPFYGAAILGLSYDQGRFADLLSHPASLYLGRISYALYMVHLLCFTLLRQVVPPEGMADDSALLRYGVVGLYLLLPIVPAIGLYHGVEEPGRKLLRAWGPAGDLQARANS